MNQFQKAAALLGCKGGKAGKGKAKARSKNQCRLAAQKRWNKKRPIKERFWEKVRRGQANECWNWKARAQKEGYGQFHVMGMPRCAHRVAWALTFGPPPKGKYVLHSCDNRKCCNPSHLYLGTQLKNMRDAWSRNRIPKLLGERNAKAKLTDAQVREILKTPRPFWTTSLTLARRYKVSVDTIRGILYHPKRWPHLQRGRHGTV